MTGLDSFLDLLPPRISSRDISQCADGWVSMGLTGLRCVDKIMWRERIRDIRSLAVK